MVNRTPPPESPLRLQLRRREILMLRFPAKYMRENPELASLRQWIFSHNAAHRSIRISPPSPHVSAEQTFWRGLVVVTATVSLDFFADAVFDRIANIKYKMKKNLI